MSLRSPRSNQAATAAAALNLGAPLSARSPRRPANPLLTYDSVGAAKPTSYDLPPDSFTYGCPGNLDREGVRELVSHWTAHEPSPRPVGCAADYVLFNKKAANARITTAKDQKHYRQEMNAVTPRYGEFVRPKPEHPLPSDVIPGWTYGRKVRPGTPINTVISNRRGAEAEDELNALYTELANQKDRSRGAIFRIHMTNAAKGHAVNGRRAIMHHEDNPSELFKLSKFKRSKAKVDNHRPPFQAPMPADLASEDWQQPSKTEESLGHQDEDVEAADALVGLDADDAP